MKKITLIILSIMLVFAKLSFADSGWQFNVMVPIGASFSFYNVSFNTSQATEDYIKNYRKSSGIIGFDAGVNLQAGYLITDGDKGISLLFDVGYHILPSLVLLLGFVFYLLVDRMFLNDFLGRLNYLYFE